MEEKLRENNDVTVDDGDKMQCNICGRKFLPEPFSIHKNVCKKVFATKRKQFDSKKNRIVSSEHAMILKNQELKEKKQGKVITNTKKVSNVPKWKKQSEEFRSVVKNQVGATLSKDDYIDCKYCGRKFMEQPYEKHLAFCMKKAKEAQMKSKITTTSNMKPNLNVKFGKK